MVLAYSLCSTEGPGLFEGFGGVGGRGVRVVRSVEGANYASGVADHDGVCGHVLGDDGTRTDDGVLPMVTPPRMMAPPPIQTLSSTVMGLPPSSTRRGRRVERVVVRNCTLLPTTR